MAEEKIEVQNFHHYGKEEAEFAKMAMKMSHFCYDKNQLKLTNFLDPYKQKILMDFCNRYASLKCIFYGGFQNAERKRALIIPELWKYQKEDYNIQALKITVTDKKNVVKHNDFLGAVLGQGVKREKVGDFFILDSVCYAVMDRVIADFISKQVYQVSHSSVEVDLIDDNTLPIIEHDFKIIESTVASLRLDSILKAALHVSRTSAVEYIVKGIVRYNWGICNSPATSIKNNDVISIRGKGKIKILKIMPVNKKGRIPVQIGKYR